MSHKYFRLSQVDITCLSFALSKGLSDFKKRQLQKEIKNNIPIFGIKNMVQYCLNTKESSKNFESCLIGSIRYVLKEYKVESMNNILLYYGDVCDKLKGTSLLTKYSFNQNKAEKIIKNLITHQKEIFPEEDEDDDDEDDNTDEEEDDDEK
jgi:hypothetical protein